MTGVTSGTGLSIIHVVISSNSDGILPGKWIPPKGIKEELDLDLREDVLALKVIEVFASDKHAPNVVKFFKWAFPPQGSADPMLHRDYWFIISSNCSYTSIGTGQFSGTEGNEYKSLEGTHAVH